MWCDENFSDCFKLCLFPRKTRWIISRCGPDLRCSLDNGSYIRVYVDYTLISLIGILEYIVEESRGEEKWAGTIREHHAGNCQWMCDVWSAGLSELFIVSSFCYSVWFSDEIFSFARDIIALRDKLSKYIIRLTFLIPSVFEYIIIVVCEIVGILCHVSILYQDAKKSIQKPKKACFFSEKNNWILIAEVDLLQLWFLGFNDEISINNIKEYPLEQNLLQEFIY